MNEHKKMGIGVLVATLGVAITLYLFATSSTPTTTTSKTTNTTPVAVTSVAEQSYTRSVSYQAPHRTESITVTLKIKDGVVTSVEDVHSKNNRNSAYFQEGFESAIAGQVVGKKIADIQLDAVAGASLTTAAFMEAITAIKGSI